VNSFLRSGARGVLALLTLATLPLQAQPVVVTFDNPAPAGAPDSLLNGTFQGINFGTSQWRWSGPYGQASTNHIYFASSAGTSRSFTFATPRILNSIQVYTIQNGTLTVSDGANPTVTRTVNTNSFPTVTTGWTQPSTTVTVGFTAGWALGVDNITHSAPGAVDTTPPTVTMTSPSAGETLSGVVTLTATAADDVGVAGVQFFLNGTPIDVEDAFPPYAATWDTTTAINAGHTLTARARDTSGNLTTSVPVGVTVMNAPGSGFGYSLRFNGNGTNDIDRVKIRVDDPATSLPGPPVDVGATDFTLEFWISGTQADNPAQQVTCGANDNWIRGNIIVDRDRYNQDRNFGISAAGGRIVFGVEGQGTGNWTVCGTSNVLDGLWHHIAVARRANDGFLWLFVDGVLEASADGPNGDISYPDNGVPGNFCGPNGSQPCTNSDPFLVIGAEKHDASVEFPSYRGLFDELRISRVLRYTGNFTRPSAPFRPDANTVGLYHFDEGEGDYIYDSSGAFFAGGPSNATRRFGGSPAGPVWVAQTPFTTPPASVVGEWSGPYNWPLVAVHVALLRTGNVLVLDGGTDLNIGGTSARLWDPRTNTFTPVPNTVTDLFCSAHSFLPDGRLLFAGGNVDLYIGLRDTNIFDPVTSTWTRAANMTQRRWYPTTLTLADGRILAINGSTNCNFCIVREPEIYDPVSNNWTAMPNAPLDITPTYPHLFLLADGRALVAAADEEPMQTYALDLETETWTTIDPRVLQGGAAVMYQPGRIMKTGTAADVDIPTTPTVRDTYVIDMNQPSPQWRATQPMAFPRGLHTLTMLPDGNVLVTGGGRTSDGVNTNQAVLEAEIWSPESWTTVAAMQRPRLYHSTALLLPDGRVLSAGSGRFVGFPQIDEFTAEIYSPPYLFRGARPIVSSVPNTAIQHGTSFFVGTNDAATIERVTLVSPGAVTHEVNMSQIFVDLAFTATSGGLNVEMPGNANIAPPGYYMLFLVGANGVPSTASFIQIGTTSTPWPAPTVSSLNPASVNAGSGGFTLTVNGSNFVAGNSVVRWNGVNRPTTFVSQNQLAASISAADVATAGTAAVTVFTAAPGGGTSNAVTFTISATGNPVPTIASIAPSSALAGGSQLALTVNGTGFVSGQSVVRWNGADRATTFVSSNQLTATIPAADIASAGTVSVTVFTPSPGGGTSNAQTFMITNPAPATTSISPTAVMAGSGALTLTVNGTGFMPGQSVVRWNGANRMTTFVSPTQLQADITAADVAAGGTVSVTVFTPTPGGGLSNAQTFTITNPPPAAVSLSPSSTPAGSGAFTLTVNGGGFVQNQSVVRWNGANRMTTFVSPTQLQADISAADVATAGPRSVTVFTPTPGGGTSEALTFTVSVADNPAPDLTALSPTVATAGGGNFTLAVTGSGFVPGSVVQWNGASRATTFVSSSSLMATITAADIASAGAATVTVLSPAPGGGTSPPRTFLVTSLAGGAFFDDFNRANNAAIGNNWTEKFPNAFSILNNEVVSIDTSPVDYHDAIVYRPQGEDRLDVEVGLEFRLLPGENFPQVHARVQRDTITQPNTLDGYVFFVDGFEPAPGRAIIARQQPVAGQFECYMLAIPFPSALTTTDRYRLRFRVTGTAPVVLEGFVERFTGAAWDLFASGSIQHGAGGTTPARDPGLYCDPGFLPPPLTTAGAVGFAEWRTANEVLDNFHAINLGTAVLPPTTTSIAPSSASAGGGDFVLTVNGTNFQPGATVTWNGSDRATTFVSSSQVTAMITAADIATAGTATVAVVNPAPGGTSNPQIFTINGAAAPAGLVAAYGFNEGSGSSVADSSGNGNNGTFANGSWTTAGRFGAAAVFNGTSSMVTIPDSNSLDLTTGISIEAWVYPTVQPTGWRAIVTKERPNSVVYYLHAGSSSSNRPATGVVVGSTEQTLFGGTRLAANTWVHLTATYDGANQRLYVNGVQVASRAQTGPIVTSTGALRIGGNSVFGEFFNGRIDEVRIYNRALTQAEIASDMNTAVRQ
jgi:hypothetical protein